MSPSVPMPPGATHTYTRVVHGSRMNPRIGSSAELNARAQRAGSSSHQATIATRGPMSAPMATMQHTRRLPGLAAHPGLIGCFLRPGEGRRAVVAAERLVVPFDDAAPIGDECVAV